MYETDQQHIERWIRAACIAEVSVPKPGNVHPGAKFSDLHVDDFLQSAEVAAPHLAQAATLGIGPAVLCAVEATHSAVGRNTNLGICLLVVPLAAVALQRDWRCGVAQVLAEATVNDSRDVYQAIRLAKPGGMGQVAAQDLSEQPTLPLKHIMRLAAAGSRETLFHPRDTIARQYAEDYWQIALALESFELWLERAPLATVIIGLHLTLMAAIPDTLIARKCGIGTAIEAAQRAGGVLNHGWPETSESKQRLDEFDAWLRVDGHRRNPGTTADLVAAVLFLALREGHVNITDMESLAAQTTHEVSE